MKKFKLACVVDDDKIFLYGIKRMMKLIGFCENLMVFHDGEEALEYLKPLIEAGDVVPEVILLDINMPIMDGWQFLDAFTHIGNPGKKYWFT